MANFTSTVVSSVTVKIHSDLEANHSVFLMNYRSIGGQIFKVSFLKISLNFAVFYAPNDLFEEEKIHLISALKDNISRLLQRLGF
jgi:hypothetical protein